MKPIIISLCGGLFLLLAVVVDITEPTCVLESDFGFKINCAFKKSGLFRVRNLGGLKAHASLGFSLGDELGFEQSLTNLDSSRRRSVNLKNAPPNIIEEATGRSSGKQEKRGKQNRIMMRPPAPANRPSQSAMDKLTSLHRRSSSTMRPIIVVPTLEAPTVFKINPTVTMAKPLPMGVPPFKPLPPKDMLKVIPIAATTKRNYSPLQVPQSKGPGVAYQNPVPHQVHDLANAYNTYNTKKVDDYNLITGYGDDTALKLDKEDINTKIAEIAKVGNISMEAVEAAIALRQQQLLSKYANIQFPATKPTTTTTTEAPSIFQSEPEPVIVVSPPPSKPKRIPTTGKVMNAPKEYYPVGYEKDFDDHFQSKVDLPETTFNCGDQKYFPGLYGDENLGCMVFHVCALTDDGLVMKSFLCPESTLFDQTILKCNWWFYVDCKNTKKLYETNIPVSKSYQLMKALTFFSSYNKELQENAGHTTNPEDVAGIKEAITILENQETPESAADASETISVVTTLPLIDERSRHKYDTNTSEHSPVYRGTRNYKEHSNKTVTEAPQHNIARNNSEIFVTHDTNLNVNKNNEKTTFIEQTTTEIPDKRFRRKTVLKNNSGTTIKPTDTPKAESLTLPFEGLHQELIQDINNAAVKQETLADQEDSKVPTEVLIEAANSSPIKRYYRSSEEEVKIVEKEIVNVKNEKVQIVRPTTHARVVGEFQTPTAAIEKLDEAILGKLNSRQRRGISDRISPPRYRSLTSRVRT